MTEVSRPPRRRRSVEVKQQQQEATRRYILDLAKQMVTEGGWPNLSLRRLAESAGYAPATIYLYFANRDEIARALSGEIYREMLEALRPAASIADPAERLQALLLAYAKFGMDNPAAYRLAFVEDPLLAHPEEGMNHPSAAEEALGLLVQAITEIRRSTEGESPVELAETTWLAMHGALAIIVSCPGYQLQNPSTLVERMVRFTLRAVGARSDALS